MHSLMKQELTLLMPSKLNLKFIITPLFLLCVVPSFLFSDVAFEKAEIVFLSSSLQGKKVTINVEVAKTEMQKMQGFMQRKNIPEGTGMIFVYDVDTRMRFWMKNTPSPLSIAFISSKGIIKEIKNLD